MPIATEIMNAISWIEQHPVVGTAILCSLGYSTIGIVRAIYRTLANTSPYTDPTFWTFGKKFRVAAVHKYLPSADSSGYKQIQHSRPDQWKTLVGIRSSILNLRHTVFPIDKEDVLSVVISRDGKENEKIISFNK